MLVAGLLNSGRVEIEPDESFDSIALRNTTPHQIAQDRLKPLRAFRQEFTKTTLALSGTKES